MTVVAKPWPTLFFSTFPITPQIFHLTPLTMCLVNIKPLLPGHILVCPRRAVPRLSQLTAPELTDLFTTVQLVGRKLEVIYAADALNIAIQDGEAAGQSVPHVHAHIIPRKNMDMGEEGSDKIYKLLESEDGNMGAAHAQVEGRPKFPTIKPDSERLPRTAEQMRAEAEWLEKKMAEID
ncbi:Bis-tetraphosphatase [Geopyxis carbonaria]|nr:Bis-tetraphosphatase [Geopyxis carbonaria]